VAKKTGVIVIRFVRSFETHVIERHDVKE